jgi:hypothetical protein
MTTTFSNTPGSKAQIEQGVLLKAAMCRRGVRPHGGPWTGPPVWSVGTNLVISIKFRAWSCLFSCNRVGWPEAAVVYTYEDVICVYTS